tara:strand:+ start:81 stop:488 length:408 start_codon:yes stop_codon:yes gene_type:complete
MAQITSIQQWRRIIRKSTIKECKDCDETTQWLNRDLMERYHLLKWSFYVSPNKQYEWLLSDLRSEILAKDKDAFTIKKPADTRSAEQMVKDWAKAEELAKQQPERDSMYEVRAAKQGTKENRHFWYEERLTNLRK